MKIKQTVTDRKRRANQLNAQHSTGPKTSQGKANARFNAVQHGLTASRLMLASDGTPIDNGLKEIVEALRKEYSEGNIVTELLIDNLIVDIWRQNKGLDAEMFYLGRSNQWSFYPTGSLSTILRYNTSNRNALLKNLQLLETMRATPQAAAEESEIEPEADTDETAVTVGGNESATDDQAPDTMPLEPELSAPPDSEPTESSTENRPTATQTAALSTAESTSDETVGGTSDAPVAPEAEEAVENPLLGETAA